MPRDIDPLSPKFVFPGLCHATPVKNGFAGRGF